MTAITVRTSRSATSRPAIVGPMKKPACIENVSQPMERPSRLAGTDSVMALKSAACCAPAPSPPTICHTKSGNTLVVVANASCEAADSTSDVHSSVREPNRSIRRPDGSESRAPAKVATENSAPTSKRDAPRSWAYRGTRSPRAEIAANAAPAAT